jgi:hypothetical protein
VTQKTTVINGSDGAKRKLNNYVFFPSVKATTVTENYGNYGERETQN